MIVAVRTKVAKLLVEGIAGQCRYSFLKRVNVLVTGIKTPQPVAVLPERKVVSLIFLIGPVKQVRATLLDGLAVLAL